MAAHILDGKSKARDILDSLSKEKSHNRSMKLASIVVGNDTKSHYFSDLKVKCARMIGLSTQKKSFPHTFEPKKVIDYIHELNDDKSVIGIVPQLPLPPQYERALVLKAIHPFKDVDCLHPKNIGLLLEGSYAFISPVVLSVLEQIKKSNTYPVKELPYLNTHITIPDLTGVTVCIIGSGLLVGKPLTAFLINQNATVLTLNEYTKNCSTYTLSSDIVITGTNSTNVIQPNDVTNGTIVIDVGGDLDKDAFKNKDIFLSTNPGGVGPLTVSYLLFNTVHAIGIK